MRILVNPGLWVWIGVAAVFWLALPSGIYLGGDWAMPATRYQLLQFFYPYVWLISSNSGQSWLPGVLGLPYGAFLRASNELGVPLENLGRFVLTFVFSLAAFNFFRMTRYFGLQKLPSAIGSLIYITTPVFFNYALMGWQYALLAMALLPLASQWFCQAVRQGDMRYAIGVAFVWTLAMLQSQSLVWFPLLFMTLGFYLSRDRLSAKAAIKKLGIIFIVFAGLSSYWWIALVLFQDENVASSAIVTSEVSIGADYYFTVSNALRLWGSLFNSQYESAMSHGWVFDSWILPVLATMAILTAKKENRRIALAMGFIAFVLPVAWLMLKEYRELLAVIPGAGLIRQLSRFTVLTSFAYAVLVVIFLDSLSSFKRFSMPLLLYPTIALLIVATWPWWMGEMTASVGPGPDFRLRVKDHPRDYYEVEKLLSEIGWISHALYLPYGISASYQDDPKFRGMFKEAGDVFAGFSPVPGALMPTDRLSPIGDYMAFLQHTDDVIAATRFAPTNFYVLRKNMEPGPVGEVFRQEKRYFSSDLFDRVWDGKNITVYARKNLIPLIYSPLMRQQHGGHVEALREIAYSQLAAHGTAMVFTAQNLGKRNSMNRFLSASKVPDSVEYRRINPTKYQIRLHHARGDVPLLFGESYSRGWRLYPSAYQIGEKAAPTAKGYTVASGNERYQANTVEVTGFSVRGWISQTGPRFISKQQLGAIQNDNLPDGSLMETWHMQPLPEERHLKINGYANGWLIDVAQLCSDSQACHRNDDGSFEVEFVMEFWPQQVFYFGLAVSVLSLVFGGAMLLQEHRNIGKLGQAV